MTDNLSPPIDAPYTVRTDAADAGADFGTADVADIDHVADNSPAASLAIIDRFAATESWTAGNGGHNRVMLPHGATRAEATGFLNQRQRTNEFGLPIMFVRSDMLPSDLSTLSEEDVEAACEGLFYTEGYPVLKDGTPFWQRLPHETAEAYGFFQAYLAQAEELGIRQVDKLAEACAVARTTIAQYYQEYVWSTRAAAFDMFEVAAEQRRRHFRVRKMEDKHYTKAAELFDALQERFSDPEWIDELSAKEAIEIAETLVKIQRMSVGLVGQHASSTDKNALGAGANSEAILRNLARNAGATQAQSDDFAARLMALTQDDGNGMLIQAAILQMSRPSSHNQGGSEGSAGMGDGFA